MVPYYQNLENWPVGFYSLYDLRGTKNRFAIFFPCTSVQTSYSLEDFRAQFEGYQKLSDKVKRIFIEYFPTSF